VNDSNYNPGTRNPKVQNDKSYSSDPGNTPYNSVEAEENIESKESPDEGNHAGLNDEDHLDETSGDEYDIY